MEEYITKGTEMVIGYAPRVLLALFTLWLGFKIAGALSAALKRRMEARKADPSLIPFVTSLTEWLFKAVVFISVAGIVGIETTSFVAMLGAGGLAVGLALQGSLANFAGGVLILLFKPFKVGDLIETEGHTGWVQEIQIFVTILHTPDSRTVILANGPVANGAIKNYSTIGKMRADMVVGIAYDADLKKAREVLMKVMTEHPSVLAEPAPTVNVSNLGDSAVELTLLPFCKAEDYWGVFFEVQENGKLVLDAAGVEIPFPQRVVHMKQ